jgi:glycerol-3-phosphate dehydrogenase
LSGTRDGEWLKPPARSGFCYYDGWADDARLVVANAMDAATRGTMVLTRTRCVRATPSGDGWAAQLVASDARDLQVRARVLVNATGPWVERFLRECTPLRAPVAARLIQGSHLVVRRRPPGDRALLLPNDDGRVVFVIPFEDDFALIGTTDVALSGDPRGAAVSQEEIDYLRRAVNRFLVEPLAEREIVWTYCGVRALHDDGSANPSRVTRDYLLQVDHAENDAPILSVYGGKLTTYRRLAEEAVSKLGRVFPTLQPAWTAHAALPGGDFGGMDRQGFLAALRVRYPLLPEDWIAGIARRHGTLADAVIDGASRPEELGAHFGAGLTAREVEYLARREWVADTDDVVWRRTKAGLRLTESEREAVARHLRDLTRTKGVHPNAKTQ